MGHLPHRRALARVLLLAVAVGLAGCDAPSEAGRPGSARAQARADGPRVRLAATHRDGVPLHLEPHDDVHFERVPDGLEVEVLETLDGGRWLKVRGGGRTGWITARYVAASGGRGGAADVTSADRHGADAPSTPPSLDPASPWASPEACEAAVAAGRRAPHPPGGLRLGTWNVRWFPDGHAGEEAEEGEGTDVGWLACLVAWMDVDAVAVQEWVTHVRGRQATLDLLSRLERLTGGRWDHALDGCPDDGRQHVGLLWNSARVEVRDEGTLGRINPGRSACQNRLRPGFVATLHGRDGVGVQVVVVHLDSGVETHDRSNRRASARYLAQLGQLLPGGERGLGVVVLGDFNTMGCSECRPELDAAAELADLEASLRMGEPSLSRLTMAPACSEYYRGHAGLLDHVFVASPSEGAAPGARAELHGVCAEYQCSDIRGAGPLALARLSDHCPLVVQVAGTGPTRP